jgi:hypothetical protein
MKKVHWPILLGLLLLVIVLFIVLRNESSPIAKFTQWISTHIEGFAAPIGDTPKCPLGAKFFNDKRGESFCCTGTVNPYTHVCDSKQSLGLCAFLPGTVDPRTGTGVLPLCSALIAQGTATAQTQFCPGRFPNYASVGKCCKHDSDLDGVNCTSLDSDPTNYCITAGNPLKAGERSCDSLRMEETATCPSSLKKTSYALGDKEKKQYGNPTVGLQIPICFGIDGSCIPDSVITTLQSKGVYTGKNLNTWSYACSNWTKRNVDRDLTGPSDTSYP